MMTIQTAMKRAAAWTLPWLAILIVSASIVFGMTAMVVGAEVTPTQANSTTALACEDRMMAYAVSTYRVPVQFATDCPTTFR